MDTTSSLLQAGNCKTRGMRSRMVLGVGSEGMGAGANCLLLVEDGVRGGRAW